MKKHSFLVSVAAAASALLGTAEANVPSAEPVVPNNHAEKPSIVPLPANADIRYYDIGSDRHAFLMKPSESGQLLAYHHSHSSHSSHSSHRSSY